MIGAAFDIKFWPYAFFNCIRISNGMVKNGQDSSRNFQATRKQENFCEFLTFWCRVWICLPGLQKAKFKHNIVKGILVGYIPLIQQNIICNNCDTGCISFTNHVCFDKGKNILLFKIVPPNKRDLERVKFWSQNKT